MMQKYGQSLFIISAVFIICLLLYIFSDVVFPFITGAVIAYAFVPLVDRLSLKFSRTAVSACITLTFVCLFIFSVIAIAPRVEQELVSFINQIPYHSARIVGALNAILQELELHQVDAISIRNLVSNNLDIIIRLILNIFSHGNAITGFFSCLIVIPVTMFYLMKDWDGLTEAIFNNIPLRYRSAFSDLADMIRKRLWCFFRSQICVSIILALYYSVSLYSISLPNAFLMGIVTGFMSFIPFVGAVACGVTSFIIGAIHDFSITKLIVIAVIYTFGPLLESYVLTPRFVGEKIGLHPLWILFAFFAGIQMYGIIGVAIAIPCASIIGEVVRFYMIKFRASAFFKS